MLDRIKGILGELAISEYVLRECKSERVELFFIKRELDMRREVNVTTVEVDIYRTLEEDGVQKKGSTRCQLDYSMTDAELREKLAAGYEAARYAGNPYYELVKGKQERLACTQPEFERLGLAGAALLMAEALYAEDNCETAFVNSAELTASRQQVRIVNTSGVDVSYIKYEIEGELVAQAKKPQDVELYAHFIYETADTEALRSKVRELLTAVTDRANAGQAPVSGTYTLILSGEAVPELMSLYQERADAYYVYAKYSEYQVGTVVQGEGVVGDMVSLTLHAQAPFSGEGIRMTDRQLVGEGILKRLHGNKRFSDYLGIEATGNYEKGKLIMPQGATSLSEMKQKPYLHVVQFSDFQMDSFSGSFGGEIRLAYLFDGTTVQPVTGGSVSGNLLELQKNLCFSKEMQRNNGFTGPYAVCLQGVSVAGSEHA